MGIIMDKTPGDPNDLIEQLRAGDRQALAALFEQHRERLRRMVELRLDQRLRARLDASDVVQEAFLDVARDLEPTWPTPRYPAALAAVARRPAVDDLVSPAPGHEEAGRGPGDLGRPGRPAPGQLDGAGGDAPGPANLADAGGPARRADAARPGGAQRFRN